jgi:biotin transport system substrate-specific component
MAQIQTKAIADRIYPAEGFAADAVRIVGATILMALCAHIVIPLPWTPVPVTGQNFGVLLVALLLGARRGALALGLYLLEGAAGLPVFQPLGVPGIARFAGPTAGYLISYPFAAWITGWISERWASVGNAVRRISGLLAAVVTGEVVMLGAGCAWLATGMGLGWQRAIAAGATPFLGVEAIKVAVLFALAGSFEFLRRREQ